MTPTEMARVFLENIEVTRALMEDGPIGYVLHDAEGLYFICERGGVLRLGNPQADDVAVYTSHARALTAQRYWNSNNREKPVTIALRRDAMATYITRQERALATLLSLIDDMDRSNK